MEELHPFVVIGVGEVQWDRLPSGRQPGGPPANVVYHAQLLGAKAVLASSVGDDPAGHALMDSLSESGLSIGVIHLDPAHATTEVDVAFDQHGGTSCTYPEIAPWDFLPFRPECARLAAKANAIIFGTLASRNPHSRECIRKFLESAMPGCLRVFDVNLREGSGYTRNFLEALLEHSEVLKLNEDELPVVTELLNIRGSMKERMEVLMDQFALDAVALTRGARGSVIMTPEHMEVHHGLRVEHVENTLGASDAFTAVLVMGLLQQWSLGEISDRANRLASFVCTVPGAMTPHPEYGLAAW